MGWGGGGPSREKAGFDPGCGGLGVVILSQGRRGGGAGQGSVWPQVKRSITLHLLLAVVNTLNTKTHSAKEIAEFSFENADDKGICSCKQRDIKQTVTFFRMYRNKALSAVHIFHLTPAGVEWCGTGHLELTTQWRWPLGSSWSQTVVVEAVADVVWWEEEQVAGNMWFGWLVSSCLSGWPVSSMFVTACGLQGHRTTVCSFEDQGPVSWMPTMVKRRQSNRHFTIGTRQTRVS